MNEWMIDNMLKLCCILFQYILLVSVISWFSLEDFFKCFCKCFVIKVACIYLIKNTVKIVIVNIVKYYYNLK